MNSRSFRGAIRVHVAVIVEMIAGQVGEGRGREGDAVEAVLREAVARRLDRDVLDAGPGQFRQIAMQRDRVRRRQRAGPPPGRRDTRPERAEARRRMAERGPDLAREMRDRGLAVGAGHGDDRVRLAPVEPRRQQGQTALRVRIDDDRHPARASRRRAPAPPASSVRIATAPRATASPAKARPSRLVPRSAANRKPGSTRRESAVIPAISGLPAGASDDRPRSPGGSGQLSKIQSAFPAGSRPSTPEPPPAMSRRPAARRESARCAG